MSKWLQRTLSEADLQIIDGDRGKNYPSKNDFSEDGFCLFLNTGNVTLRGFDFSNTMFIDEERDKLLRKGKLQRGDVILTTRGTVGNVAYYGNDVDFEHIRINSGMVIIRTVAKQLDPRFVYFFLRSRLFANQVKALTTGSAQPQLPIRDMVRISMPNPPICEQVKIASVLGALDDKIENNRRMNETLEEMARAIFKSWFVDFDPVHAKAAGNAPAHMDAETAALFPSSFGDDGLPSGWNKVSADTISRITIGKTPPRKEHQWFSNSSDDVNWASIRDMGECGTYILQTTEMLTAEAIKKFNVRVVPKNTVILSFKLTVGRVAITDDEIATNEAIAHFGQLDSEYGLIQPEYLYAYLKEFNFDRLGSTSSIATAVNSKTIKAMPIMLANVLCRDAFQKLALPLFSKINCNQKENQTLAELRDTLLPKLMSGEIRVKDAEREVEAAI